MLWLCGLLVPAPMLAQGGLAISGSFHNQDFVIPQGSSISGPSIDVVVFNNGIEAINIKMTSQAPPGVTISLSEQNFTLGPAEQRQVLVGVAVAATVAPGQYDLNIAAQSYIEAANGIQIAGAAGQNAKLTVTGESAQVTLQALSPDGQPIVATVRLYRVVNGQDLEVASSQTGNLQTTVVPGSYTADSYVGGQQVAEQSFTLAANDKITVNLSGATVYFASFGVVPNYDKDSGKLAFVQVVYTIKNLYQQVNTGDILLQVSFNGTPLAPITLNTLSPLAVGSAGLNSNYVPNGGWVDGSYDFKLDLNLDGKYYTSSTVAHLDVGSSGTTSTSTSSSGSTAGSTQGISPYLFGGIIAGVVVAAGITVFLFRRKK